MPEIKKYRKRPLTIEAIQVDNKVSTFPALTEFLKDSHAYIPTGEFRVIIPAPEGDTVASVGDWIIRGVAGEYYPCPADVFALTYEEITNG